MQINSHNHQFATICRCWANAAVLFTQCLQCAQRLARRWISDTIRKMVAWSWSEKLICLPPNRCIYLAAFFKLCSFCASPVACSRSFGVSKESSWDWSDVLPYFLCFLFLSSQCVLLRLEMSEQHCPVVAGLVFFRLKTPINISPLSDEIISLKFHFDCLKRKLAHNQISLSSDKSKLAAISVLFRSLAYRMQILFCNRLN